MNSVVTSRARSHSDATSIIVLIDMQRQGQSVGGSGLCDETIALGNCRRLLTHARALKYPIAFMRRTRHAGVIDANAPFGSWIDGLAPQPDEMVFDRHLPSCYASNLFANLVDQQGVSLVLAGLAGESSCLSTMIDAFHRGHHVTFLADASASHSLNGFCARESHRAVCSIGRLYGEVCETEHWMATAVSGRVVA